MTEADIKANLLQLATDLTKEGASYFEKSISRAGLVLTGGLRDSVDYIVKDEVGKLSLTAELQFQQYGRFKDMAQLRYSEFPNIDAFEKFVEEVGLDKFAFVNGYKGKAVPTVKNAEKRIVWSILMARKMVPVVRQPANKRWYNSVKSAYLNVMNRRLSVRLSEILPTQLKDVVEN
jgi:hypothetical protein